MKLRIKQYTQDWHHTQRIILVSDKGSVLVDIYTTPDDYGARAFIWGLYVNMEHRQNGIGGQLLARAEEAARKLGHNIVALEWERPTPLWVYDWYVRRGYDEKEFGDGCSRLYKTLT